MQHRDESAAIGSTAIPACGVCASPAWRGQRGTYSIEFALVFPLFFLLFYALLTYGLVFAAQESLNFAAEGAARAALRWPQGVADSLSARADQARSTALDLAGWVGALGDTARLGVAVCDGQGALLSGTAGVAGLCGAMPPDSLDAQELQVVVRYAYGAAPLVPLLGGSLMSFAVPDTLVGNAHVSLAVAQDAALGG